MPEATFVPSVGAAADVVEQRLYDLERRRRATPAQNDEEDCCVTYCKILTANALDLAAFNANTSILTLSVPILNAGRAIISINTTWILQADGSFWIQVNPTVAGTNYEPMKEYQDQVSKNGDRCTVDVAAYPFDYAAGTTGFVSFGANLFNLSSQTARLRSATLTVQLKGRHGSVHCDPATIGQ